MKKFKRFIFFLFLFFLLCGGVLFYVNFPHMYEYYIDAKNTVQESTPESFRPNQSSYVYDINGDLIAKLQPETDSNYIFYDETPEHVINAFVSIEDKSFWKNQGIDLKGIIRVLWNYITTKGEEAHGASTITQQLSRNVFLSQDVTIERKIREIFYSFEITNMYSKKEIMEFYINNIYYANSYYGIDAAAKGYFNKATSDLTLSEIAYLCAIPNNPSEYDPIANPDNALTRRDLILESMVNDGYITQEQCDKAKNEKINFQSPSYNFDNYAASYALDCAASYIMKRNGFKYITEFPSNEYYEEYSRLYKRAYDSAVSEVFSGGYHIYTSIDVSKQEKLQKILDDVLSFDETLQDNGDYALQGALTAIDNNTGKVIAIIGGRSQETSPFSLNRAFQSYRQPGSSIKPLLVYAPSLEHGYSIDSALTNIDVNTANSLYEQNPNYNFSCMGGSKMQFRNAVEQSVNGCAWWLLQEIGTETGMSYLQNMNFSKLVKSDFVPASALGGFTFGVTTTEMAGAYHCLSNDGNYRQPTCLISIIDDTGTEIYEDESFHSVYSKETTNDMTNVMTGVFKNGTASELNWYSNTDIEAAGKTGTTNNSKDGWLCGYTPYYTLSVWVGYDTPKELSSLYGATYPGQIWRDSMLELIKNKKNSTDK